MLLRGARWIRRDLPAAGALRHRISLTRLLPLACLLAALLGGCCFSISSSRGQAAVAGAISRLGPRRPTESSRSRSRRTVFRRATSVMDAADDVARSIAEAGFGEVLKKKHIGSSDWSSFMRVTTSSGKDLFVKTSAKKADQMFKPEALGLKALRSATEADGLMRIPEVYAYGDRKQGSGSYIIMEHLSLGGQRDDYALGKAMGAMHAHSCPEARGFGFDIDNTIGETPQINTWCDDWVEFFCDRRLRYQVQRAGDGYAESLFKSIAPRLHKLFAGIGTVRPSILHGDLWSGNIGSADGLPSIFDPAVYYGHHEAEWGMSWATRLSSDFWQGYREVIPEDPGFEDRAPLYEAYHQLNHYNLFGGGYLQTSIGCLESVKSSLDELE